MEPGDAVLFDYRTVHGARANMSKLRRRAFSMRWLGDDMRYIAVVAGLGSEQRRKWKEVLYDRENPGASSVNQDGIGFRVVLRVGK